MDETNYRTTSSTVSTCPDGMCSARHTACRWSRSRSILAHLALAAATFFLASCEPPELFSGPSGGLSASLDPASHHILVKFFVCDSRIRVTSLQIYDISDIDQRRAGKLIATFTPDRGHQGAPWEFVLGRGGFSGGTTTIDQPAVFASVETMSIDRAVVVTVEGPIDPGSSILGSADVVVDIAALRRLPKDSVILVDRPVDPATLCTPRGTTAAPHHAR